MIRKKSLINGEIIDADFGDMPEFGAAHATNSDAMTGCTLFVARAERKDGVACGVDVRGGAPATRETDLLKPENMVQRVNAVMIGGGSAFGLEAACGAMEILADEGFGFELRGVCVPIVPAACLFDLLIGEPVWPDKAMGAQAARQALAFDANKARLEIGSVGAGCGATINKTGDISEIKKGGFGYKGLRFGDLVVIACAAVNSLGDVVGAASSEIALDALCENAADNIQNASEPCSNTTLGVVLTNAKLDKAQATKVAQMTQDAYARAIVPAHTTNDGDTIFTLASGKVEADINAVGALACAAMEAAIHCAVIND